MKINTDFVDQRAVQNISLKKKKLRIGKLSFYFII